MAEENVPAGKYARRALQSAGILEAIGEKLVNGTNSVTGANSVNGAKFVDEVNEGATP